MIIPTKHLKPQDSLLGIGGVVLDTLRNPCSVSDLWSILRDNASVSTYERLILTLDLLFIIGAIDYRDGLLVRRQA